MTLDILLVEDSPNDAELIRHALRKSGVNCRVRLATSRESFTAELRTVRPDLIISDHSLPQFEGRDALRLNRESRDPPPFILVTGSLDEETAVEYMRNGAADYVLKDRLVRLGAAVTTAVQRDHDRRAKERSEAARRQMEERLSLLVRATNDAIWDLDVLHGTLEVNEGFRALIGHKAGTDPLTLERWHARIHDADRARVVAGLRSVLDSRASYWTDDYRLRIGDGSFALVLDRGYIMRDEAGQPVRMIGALMDVTERQRLNEQLQQAQKMEAIGRLAGGIAHDFNNVLAGILMSTDLILSGGVSGDEALSDLREIHAAAERAAQLTRQLLAFSRKQVITLRRVDLNETITSFGSMLKRLLGESIELVERLPNPLGTVRADPGQIEQILLNLAVNARDAMPDGGTLRLETFEVDRNAALPADGIDIPPGPYVVLAVSDTGHGMDADTKSRIFEPFFTTKGPGKGTGLGLATVYGIVRQHGGHIAVDSHTGRGTTFQIFLPRVDGKPEPRSGKTAVPTELDGTETILLIEDEPRVRQLMCRILERRGYRLLLASDGVEAIEVARHNRGRFALVISDVVLPGMNGPAAAASIISDGFTGPVLFLSGYSEETVMRRAQMQPGAMFLAKPFTPDALALAVRQALRTARRVE